MPLLVEEFGAKQESGDRARADYFRLVYATAAQAKAAGIGFWNLGPELAPGSYEVGLQTPLTFAAIRQSAPVAPAEQVVYFNDFNSPPGSEFPEWSSPGYTYPGGGGPQKVTNVRSPNGAPDVPRRIWRA
jgi:hypothetical protein